MNEREILRYLGYRTAEPDENTLKLIAQAKEAVVRDSSPAHILRRFPVETDGAQVTIVGAGISAESKNLANNLDGCKEVYLMAATLGAGADRLLSRNLRLNMPLAVVIQATEAAYLEEYIDSVQSTLENEIASKGEHLRPRFSPGYGDLPLTIQESFLAALEAGKRLGITLSAGDIMIPEKSVTAIMGVGTTKSKHLSAGCAECDQKDCEFHHE